MVKRWLFIRLCVARAQVAKLKVINRALQDVNKQLIEDRNQILDAHYKFVERVSRRR